MQGQFTRSLPGSEAQPGAVRPRFYMEPVQDELASAREGRPIFRQVERVEIFLPGNPYTMPVHNVTDEHRNRWGREYELFRRGMEQTVEGTPIAEWPILNRAQVRELQGIEIQTIEEVAALSDVACQRVQGLQGLRNKARAYLDDAAALALTEKLSAENDALRADQVGLQRQVDELSVLVKQLHAENMSARNTPHPIATAIPGLSDPMALAMQQAGMEPREDPRSSLSGFSNEQTAQRRGPGRPRKEEAA